MQITKTHRVFNGLHFVYIEGADTSIVFFVDREKQQQVRLVLADGRSYTRFTLGEFCELMYAVQKEIASRHWDDIQSTEELMQRLNQQAMSVSD